MDTLFPFTTLFWSQVFFSFFARIRGFTGCVADALGLPLWAGAGLWRCNNSGRDNNGLGVQPIFYEFCMADIFALTREALAGLDLELVYVERAPLGLLRLPIDRPEGVRIDDCALVCR